MAWNAGSEGSIVLEKVKNQDFGLLVWRWNAATDSYEDVLTTVIMVPETVTTQHPSSIPAFIPAAFLAQHSWHSIHPSSIHPSSIHGGGPRGVLRRE